MTLRNLILFWFAASIFIEVSSSVVLCIWLRVSGIKVSPFLNGFPGYLERLYAQRSQSHGHSGKAVLVFRRISMVNCLVAAVAGILVLSNGSGAPQR
jgi:hypothetical protein